MPAFTPPPLPSDDKRWKIVNGTMRKNGFARHALIETLHTVQSSFGYLDDDAIRFVARSLRVPLSQAYGVVTFYHYFSLKPPGKHTMTICAGTACYIKGADKLVAAAEKRLGIPQGQTTKDGKISLMTARCVGACSRAPVVLVRRRSGRRDDRRADARATGKVGGRMTIEELEQIAKSVRQENAKFDYEVNVCMDLACASQGADKLKDALVKAAEASGKNVLVRRTGCMGPCSAGPLVRVDPDETLYQHVNADHAEAIVAQPGRRARSRAAVRSERALRQAGARGAGERRLHRSGKDRRLHRPRRLQGAADGADRDDAQRRDSPDHRERPARARRRRLSHRPEVGHGGQGRAATSSTWSATATRATPAHSWIAA